MSLRDTTLCFTSSPVWLGAFAAAEALDTDFISWARAHRLDGPMIWAGLLEGADVDYDRNKMVDFLTSLGALTVEADEVTRRVDMGIELARVARGLGAHWSSQVSRLQDPVFALDRAEVKRRLVDDSDFQRQTRLRAIAALTPPTE